MWWTFEWLGAFGCIYVLLFAIVQEFATTSTKVHKKRYLRLTLFVYVGLIKKEDIFIFGHFRCFCPVVYY